jgi:hypothetical protein
MEKVEEFKCTEEQYKVLVRNKDKYVSIDEKHFRIRPITPDVSAIPSKPINYRTYIERLDAADNQWGDAKPEACEVVRVLFKAK